MDILEYRLIINFKSNYVNVDKETAIELFYGGNENIIIKSSPYDIEGGIAYTLIPRHILEKFIEMIKS